MVYFCLGRGGSCCAAEDVNAATLGALWLLVDMIMRMTMRIKRPMTTMMMTTVIRYIRQSISPSLSRATVPFTLLNESVCHHFHDACIVAPQYACCTGSGLPTTSPQPNTTPTVLCIMLACRWETRGLQGPDSVQPQIHGAILITSFCSQLGRLSYPKPFI